jgi:K(+)-stimulated pyrophosphate-energized sodium pump
LVIAPILGGHSEGVKKEMKYTIIEMNSSSSTKVGKCDMSKCATMTKDACAKMCDSLGCSAEEKAICMSHYDANGNFIAKEGSKACCAMDADKNVKVEIKNVNGKAKATVTTTENGNVNVQVFEGTLEDVKAKVEALK